MNHFYVYEHWRPDTGVCFYVGKGSGRRAWQMAAMRNQHFRAVVSKLTSTGLAVDIRIIARDLAEADALDLEVQRIAFYGLKNLANQTGGGDGMKRPSEATRAKISASQKRRFLDPAERAKLSVAFTGRVTSEATKAKLALISTGFKHSEEAKEKIRAARKAAGIPPHVREAQRLAVTGMKRPPISEETRRKMCEVQQHLAKQRRNTGAV